MKKNGAFDQKVEFLCYKLIVLPKFFDENWQRYEPENNSITEN
jgi:hypothetical protein